MQQISNKVMLSPFMQELEEIRQVVAHMEQNNDKPFIYKEPRVDP